MGTCDDYWISDFGDYFENIVEFDVTGIDKTTTSTDVEEVARYSVNGQRLSAPTKGLNIVKYSDGSVKKGKHSIASEAFCMNQVTFALQNIKIRLWQAVKILNGYWNFITRSPRQAVFR